jgi:hypothetical protein
VWKWRRKDRDYDDGYNPYVRGANMGTAPVEELLLEPLPDSWIAQAPLP